MNKVKIALLRTGVPGLDEVLGGGLPEFSLNLIAGLPGCGKTTLAHQIMFALATPERPALYFTVLGEPPLKMLRYQQQFEFFDGEAINKSVRFISLGDGAVAGDLADALARIVADVETYGPALIFVDSFRSLTLAAGSSAHASDALPEFIQRLGVLLTSWQATTFLIGEYFNETDVNPVFSVADGLIWLRQSVQRNSMVRKLEIMKMRGQATLPGLHTFRIGPTGVEVFPPSGAYLPDTLRRTRVRAKLPIVRMGMGTPLLDEMMGGGLPRGYSLLVVGPSGSGKSILAMAFLAEGVRVGETGVLASFEQPTPSRIQGLDEMRETGCIGIVDTRAPDLSIDEIVRLIISEVNRLAATRVVIDSLSGFELSLAPTFRDDFRESMSRLVTALAATGVTVLMTSELEDRYIDLRFSPYGTAFLTDAIIVNRYIEVDGRLRRMMAVVKVRGSAHSDELRLYTIDESGIRIGAVLAGHEGLLGGSPTIKVAGDQLVALDGADDG
ncbi:MAG: AAA family ATPase [Proteobacteria bacterium]|nr:AAA family ATPase [Burkholderiales bacterium]